MTDCIIDTIRMGTGVGRSGWVLTGLQEWWEHPALKSSPVSRAHGHGDYTLPDEWIDYDARVVTITGEYRGSSRTDSMSAISQLARLNERHVPLRVISPDAGTLGTDTQAHGIVAFAPPKRWDGRVCEFTLTILCEDPRRYSTTPLRFNLYPATANSGGGLKFPLKYPMSFNRPSVTPGNSSTIANRGNTVSYPTFAASNLDSLMLEWSDGHEERSLVYPVPIGAEPLRVNTQDGTLRIGSLDVSGRLTSRGFPVVQAEDSISISLLSAGGGRVSVTASDTWI